MKEIWKPVTLDGVKPYYSVSTEGRFINRVTGKFLNPCPDKGGYLTIGFGVFPYTSESGSKRKQRRYLAHRVVALTFIPNPNPLINTTVNHINGDKTDNRVVNLEWMSNSDNVKDSYKRGAHKRRVGIEVSNNQYSEKQIHHVCSLLALNKLGNKKIAELTGVPANIVGFIKARKIWTHISDGYQFNGPNKKMKYERYHKEFIEMIKQGATWPTIKEEYGFKGNDVKTFRCIYKRLRKRYQ